MKKTLRTLELCAAIGLLAAGCQKEFSEPGIEETAQSRAPFSYTVNGERHTEYLTDDAKERMIDYLFDLAEQGYKVTLNGKDNSPVSSKDVITYTTKDRDDAIAWSISMKNRGFDVDIAYNSKTKTYICTAVN